VAWAELIVTTAGALPPLLDTIRGWSRRNGGCELSVELDGDRVSIPSGPLSDEQERALQAWLRKHDK
jgi:hypothetical protein